MMDEYNPLQDKTIQVMNQEGEIVNETIRPDLSDEELLEAYRFMLFARTADLMSVSYQRQGRLFTLPPNLGQEAIAAAAGKQMNRQDWLVPAFREMGAWLLKGAKLSDIFLYWGGFEEGSRFSDAPRFLPSSVPIASQLQHAAGIAYAMKLKKDPGVVFAFVGDGGTSQGDFHEALNVAAVWKVPMITIIQNNQFAISVPVAQQTASVNLAVKALAYGMPGIKVDGNDYLAVYQVVSEAKKVAAHGGGPVLIEALTYRLGAHTTSDDPTLYRSAEEEKTWQLRDPLRRIRLYLERKGMWAKEQEAIWMEEFRRTVEKEFAVYEQHAAYELEDVFRYQYREMPENLKRQLGEQKRFLKWQEVNP